MNAALLGRVLVAASVSFGLVLGGLSAVPAVVTPSAAATVKPAINQGAMTLGPMKQVAYLGYRVRVPSSWPVIDLARKPATCVRVDRHAVYLGTPGANELCPAKLVAPHTGALLIAPLTRPPAKPGFVEDPQSHVIVISYLSAAISVTATYGSDRALVEAILATALTPSTRAPGNPAPPVSVLDRPPAAPKIAAGGPRGPTSYTGNGFDRCEAPRSSDMTTYMNKSGYHAIGIYIGGSDRGCMQSNLTSTWVDQEWNAGWHFIPLYAGPQAAAINSSGAVGQGARMADDAISQAQWLGFGPGNPIYYDMEAYTCSCAAQVTSFLSGWTAELHDYGYESGVYGPGPSTMRAMVSSYSRTSNRRPDVIDYATADKRANVSFSNLPSPNTDVPNGYWANHQRINQYALKVADPNVGTQACRQTPPTDCIDKDYLDVAVTASPDTGMNGMWNSYGDGATCADWSGGDATNSVQLPSGDRAWFFSDTYLGSPAARKTLFFSSATHNSIVLQNGSDLAKTITGGNTCQETNQQYAKTPATAPDASNGGFFWTGDQMVVGTNVVKFYYHGYPVVPRSFAIDYPAVASIPVSSLENNSVLTVTPTAFTCGPGSIIWGTALLSWNGAVYVYGWNSSGLASKGVYLAKTTPGGLTNPASWSLWDGLDRSGNPIWASGCSAAAALPISDPTTGFSVYSINNSLWLIQFDYTNGQLAAAGAIAAHPATTPWGFGNKSVALYYPPQGHVSYPYYYQDYEARIQPGLGGSRTVVLSYNVNTSSVDTGCVSANYHDASIYRPRFVDVAASAFDAAAAAPAPATVPAAVPYGIRRVGLISRPLAAAIRAHAAPARAPAGAAAASGIDGTSDWYDMPIGSNCPQISPPSSLTAAPPQPDGAVNLTWAGEGSDVWYYAFDCDKTVYGCTQESSSGGYVQEWTGRWKTTTSGTVYPVTSTTTQLDQSNGHVFAFYVRSFGAGNGSGGGNSPIASETVTVQPPSTPSGLTGTNIGTKYSGEVDLAWNQVTYPSTSVSYTVYACDTARPGGCGPWPNGAGWLSEGGLLNTTRAVTGLTPGDPYEFCVQASNLGGVSPCSSFIQITASTTGTGAFTGIRRLASARSVPSRVSRSESSPRIAVRRGTAAHVD